MFFRRLLVPAIAASAMLFQISAHATPPVAPSMPDPVPGLTSVPHAILPSAEAVAKLPMNAVEATDLLLTMAMSMRGTPYVWGGHTPAKGFDCSGLVRYVFRHALGVVLPRNSRSQYAAGSKVDRDSLQPGDLVFFRTHGSHVSHVGIYLDGGRFIHAPSRGEQVRVDSLDEAYWARHFVGARRPDTVAAS
ncbi:MAG TPA: C40 family peptidase [Rhodanobacteraceae bacterium]|jgi:cell wall-associated NlpC family hydrolase|nr:C40 family peptidase [Rhodanobacteraceae bacterium]